MIERINQIRSQSSIIKEIPPSIVSQIETPPVVRPIIPVTRGVRSPVVDVPEYELEYPELNPQQVEEYQEEMDTTPPIPPVDPPETPSLPVPDTRDLPLDTVPSQPVIEVGGIDIPLPDPAPIVAASAMAVATTMAALGSAVLVTQAKMALDPLLKKIAARSEAKKKKVKIKKTKTILHFIPNEKEGLVDILEYTNKGVNVVDSGIEKIEQYLRDQIEENSFYEYENKIMIDDVFKNQFTREGAKRFKSYFVQPKAIVKKLGSKFAF